MTPIDPEPMFDCLSALPLWHGRIVIEPLAGGLTNRNYYVSDGERVAMARFGEDIPCHGILRFNELAASRAAAAAGVSPAVLHAEPGLLVIDWIDGRTFVADDVRGAIDRIAPLMQRVHREMPKFLRGPILSFHVFHVVRDYGARLIEEDSRHAFAVPDFLDRAAQLEKRIGPADLVFGHNDLLPANLIDDGDRLWLVDWDYAGFNTPLFDLAGLASNAGFSEAETNALLEAYLEQPVDDAFRLSFAAMQAASLLRETLWSMVSEAHSTLACDYAAYTAENLVKFEKAWEQFRAMEQA